jgi:hypothetical protein
LKETAIQIRLKSGAPSRVSSTATVVASQADVVSVFEAFGDYLLEGDFIAI